MRPGSNPPPPDGDKPGPPGNPPRITYRPMTGVEARTRLNELGYPVRGDTNHNLTMLGIVVALAEEIEVLRERLDKLENKA